MYLSMKQKNGHREQTSGCQGGGVWGGMEGEVGISRCKLLCIGWIHNKVLLYSTENYIHYTTINHNGKEYLKKECMTKSPCCTAVINTTL